MSTRANIIITDGSNKLYFYRHSDGYPEGTLPTLKIFASWVKSGKIRDNVQQSAGWLVLIGANEYKTTKPEAWKPEDPKDLPKEKRLFYRDYEVRIEPEGWEVGAYEPTTGLHGDIEYLYEVDLKDKEITVKKVGFDHDEQTFIAIDVIKF